MKTHQPV